MLENVIKRKYLNSNIDELSESVQNSYAKFAVFINSADSQFAHVSPELIEQIIDFFEKVVMTRNHKWVCTFPEQFHCEFCLFFFLETLDLLSA